MKKSIIHENRSGFLKGRNIASHIRLLDDIMRFVDSEQFSGLVISLYYRKVFDTIDKEIFIVVVKKFNFGSNFRQYIETILANTQSSLKNGGWLSHWFSTSRGVRQGSCVSPLLFVMVAELKAINIRSIEDIKGILKDSTLHDNL